jgi:hypothetical protein
MKTIKSLEKKIETLKAEIENPSRFLEKEELEEALQDALWELEELEDAEQDQSAWEEVTGTTSQDLYNERNSYAICQSEMIDRFRNEY